MQASRVVVVGLGGLSVLLWLASYSWVVGLAPPTQWISEDASPWLIAELAAAPLGLATLGAGSLVAWRSPPDRRRTPLLAAVSGAFVMTMTLLSLLAE